MSKKILSILLLSILVISSTFLFHSNINFVTANTYSDEEVTFDYEDDSSNYSETTDSYESDENSTYATLIINNKNNLDENLNSVFEIRNLLNEIIGEYVAINGRAIITNLERGAYIVKQKEAPECHLPAQPEIITITEAVSTIDIVNESIEESKKSTLIINNINSITKENIDSVFEITTLYGMIIGEYRTDHGKAVINDLESDAYIIRQKEPPPGYKSSNSEIVTLNEETKTINILNTPTAKLIIKRIDGDTKELLPNAIFAVDGAEYKTDRYGEVVVDGLLPSTYVVSEIEAPDGYIKSKEIKTITIAEGKEHRLEFSTQKLSSIGINLSAKDSKTKRGIADIEFIIENAYNTYRVATNAFGYAKLDSIPSGSYMVLPTENNRYISVGGAQKVELKDTIQQVDFEFNSIGKLVITKRDGVSKNKLSGAKYKIETSGKVVGEYSTDSFGSISLELPDGRYAIKEIEAPTGYALNDEIKIIDIADGDAVNVDFDGYSIVKINIANINSITKEPIANNEFILINEAGEEISKHKTNEAGEITISNLKNGSYHITQYKAPEGYIKESRQIAVIFKNNAANIEIQTVPIQGIVKLFDFENDTTLVILDQNKKEVQRLHVVNGSASSGMLPYGKYTLKTADNADNGYSFEVNKSSIIDITADVYTTETTPYATSNQTSAKIDVTIKTSTVKEALAGSTIKYEFSDIQNKSAVTLDKLRIHEKIPSTLKLTRFFTGQFNIKSNLTVSYKTNKMSSFKTLSANLDAMKISEIDLSAVRLTQDEFITDMLMEFEKVDARFKEIEKPFLYAYVNADISTGYKITNSVTITGFYKAQSADSEASFTTVVMGKGKNR